MRRRRSSEEGREVREGLMTREGRLMRLGVCVFAQAAAAEKAAGEARAA